MKIGKREKALNLHLMPLNQAKINSTKLLYSI